MLSRFKQAALSVVTSSNRPGRERLKAAIAARSRAQRAVTESGETVARLAAVIRNSDDAARAAANATHQATEARREWVRNGCKHSESRALQAIDDAAAEAARAAELAGRDADVINKTRALAHAESAVGSQQADLRGAEDDIGAAIGAILADELAPDLELLERLAADYRAARIRIMALMKLLNPSKWAYTPDRCASVAAYDLIDAALGRATIKPWDEERDAADARDFVDGARGRDAEMLEQLRSKWRDRAAQLRADPDA
jgi:hypothetical protein